MCPSFSVFFLSKVVVCDGSEVLQLLEDKEHFAEVAKAMFEQFEKASVTKDQIFESVQNMRNELRLPPPKDMAKHHTVLEKVFAGVPGLTSQWMRRP